MRALNRKLVRDLSHMRGQVITVGLVIACGVAAVVALRGTHRSLVQARDAYYERHRFPDVFASLERAPDALRARIEALPGVARVETRIAQPVRIRMAGARQPAIGQLVSASAGSGPALGAPMLRRGRMFEPGRGEEVVVLESFAEAHALELGDRLTVVLAGVERRLRVVGIALAPEYVFAVAPGEAMPDPSRFGVLWMERGVIAAAFGMQGGFNDVVIRLQPGASERGAINALNRLLEPYGGLGAHGRDRQLSHAALRGELSQLTTLTAIMPTIFLGVAAFLINVVLSRLVQLQRTQIAVLKAVGYRRLEIGAHYLGLTVVLIAGGCVLGIALGDWLGHLFTNQYRKYFHFPNLRFALDLRLVLVASACAAFSALFGALSAVAAVMRLPAAEAMRPEQPSAYRLGLADRTRISALLSASARMVLREIERRPLRLVLSSLGVAMAVALLVVGRFNVDAIDWFMAVQFELSQREDVAVTFRRDVPERALGELAHLPGVRRVEGMRTLPVHARNGHRSRETVLLAYPPGSALRRPIDQHGRIVEPAPTGVMLSSALARILSLRLGDTLIVEPLRGERRRYALQVTRLIDDIYGLSLYMSSDALARMLRDEGRVSLALLHTDANAGRQLQVALNDRPEVLAVNRRREAIAMFREQTAGQLLFTTLIVTLFAVVIAVGIIYNNARIALSTRSRDLASMRVLGFRRSEVSAILIGELGVQVLLALVPGMWVGGLIAQALVAGADPEVYRFPAVISARTYAFAAAVTLAASLASALVVRRRIDRLDLIGVLKSRE